MNDVNGVVIVYEKCTDRPNIHSVPWGRRRRRADGAVGERAGPAWRPTAGLWGGWLGGRSRRPRTRRRLATWHWDGDGRVTAAADSWAPRHTRRKRHPRPNPSHHPPQLSVQPEVYQNILTKIKNWVSRPTLNEYDERLFEIGIYYRLGWSPKFINDRWLKKSK